MISEAPPARHSTTLSPSSLSEFASHTRPSQMGWGGGWAADIGHACLYASVCAKSLQSCLTLYEPMNCSLPGFSVHGILQARRGGCHFLLQGIFLTQALNPHLLCLLHWQASSLPLAPTGKPVMPSDPREDWYKGR